jgi:Tol biopolymer transport system component
MGEVYRARDRRLGRDVALKILPPDFASDTERLRRFEQEARAAGALNHPNLVMVFDTGVEAGAPYVVFELLDGPTLRQALAPGRLPPRKALDYGVQIARGLAAAHDRSIVHRDLKPENVVLTRDGRAKIIDFGLAKLRPALDPADQFDSFASTATDMTERGTVLGTAGYMSPEQVQGRPADQRSDIFSLGAILYEMFSGRRAFAAETSVETMTAVLRHDVPDLAAESGASPAVARIVRRCLEKRPEDRFQSARDVAFALEAVSDVASATDAPRPPAAARRRLSPRALAAAVAVLGLLVLAFTIGRRASRAAPAPEFHQLTFRHGTVSGARMAADGRSVVYRATWTGEPAELYTVRPESPESGALGLRGAGIFSISSAGEMAIALGCRLNWGECIGTLARLPLTGGTPREVMTDVHGADWAPDGKTLAAVQFTGGVYRLHFPIGIVLYEARGWITHPRVSPNGDLVAFLDHPSLGDIGGSVMVVDKTGRKRTLSSGWKALQGLAWASGEEIWFSGSRVSEGGSLKLSAVTVDGRERVVFSSPGTLQLYDISRDRARVLLTRGTPRGGIVSHAPDAPAERDLSWFDYSTVADLSPDGRTLLFYEWGEGVGGTPTAYLRKTDGSPAVRLGEGRPLALSPDARWALAVQPGPPPQLVLLPTGPGEPRALPRGSVTDYYDWAAWSPSGRRIFFAAEEGSRKRTFIQDLEGGEPRPLTPEGLVGTLLSPDGSTMIALDRYGEYYLFRVAGGEPQPLEGYVDGDTVLQWSADGRALFVREAGNLTLRIHKLDFAGGRRQFWKELAPPDPAALVDVGSDPGQVRLTPDGRAYAYTYWTFVGELYLGDGLR